MKRSVLQIPIDIKLRNSAEKKAQARGFSSLQEVVRVLLTNFVDRKIDIGFEEKEIQLSDKAIKRYNKMIDDIESGRVKTKSFTDVDSLMNHLNE